MKITGLMINYYFVCKRKLWYNSRNINLEEDNENVQIGKLIDENSYNLETKQIMIEETVNIDFIRHWKVIHEVKKSKSIEEAAIWQVKYYIYFLKQRGIDIEKIKPSKKGNKKRPNLKPINTTSKTKAIYTIKYNFLKSKLL